MFKVAIPNSNLNILNSRKNLFKKQSCKKMYISLANCSHSVQNKNLLLKCKKYRDSVPLWLTLTLFMKTVKVKNLSVSHLKKVHSAKASLTGVLHEIWTSGFCRHNILYGKTSCPKFFSFVAGVVYTGDKPLLSNISAKFCKSSKWPKWGTHEGPLGNLFMKKPEAENLVQTPFN